MGRIFEYAYLVAALGLGALLAVEYKEYSTSGVIAIALGAGICAFMYSFRRKQRKMFEQRERESSAKEDKNQEPHDN